VGARPAETWNTRKPPGGKNTPCFDRGCREGRAWKGGIPASANRAWRYWGQTPIKPQTTGPAASRHQGIDRHYPAGHGRRERGTDPKFFRRVLQPTGFLNPVGPARPVTRSRIRPLPTSSANRQFRKTVEARPAELGLPATPAGVFVTKPGAAALEPQSQAWRETPRSS